MEEKAIPGTAEARTRVFIVRIWGERQDASERQVRIQARDALSGEIRYFGNWEALVAYLSAKLDAASSAPDE